MKAIEHIAAGFSSLKDRKALEEIRDHRVRLLNEHRMRVGSVLQFPRLQEDLREEIAVVEAALAGLEADNKQPSIND